MSTVSVTSERPEAPLFSDGLGDRVVAVDNTSGDLLQILRLKPALLSVASFEFALRERTARLANFRHAYYARVRRVDRYPGGLAIVSDHVEGTRISDLLRVAAERHLQLDVNAALCLVRQLVPAVALLHENARDVAHGLIGPERLIVTPHARLVIAEHVLGSAVEQLQYGREKLWQDLRVALPQSAGAPRFDHRTDVTGMGLVALALVLGRPLRGDEYPHRIPLLLNEARARSTMGDEQPLSASLRGWLARALQLDLRRAFTTAPEALAAFEDVLSEDNGYVAAPVALETFLSRYIASLLEPMPPAMATTFVPPAPAPPPPASSFAAPPPPAVAATPVTAPESPWHVSVRDVSAQPTPPRPAPPPAPPVVSAPPARPPDPTPARGVTRPPEPQTPPRGYARPSTETPTPPRGYAPQPPVAPSVIAPPTPPRGTAPLPPPVAPSRAAVPPPAATQAPRPGAPPIQPPDITDLIGALDPRSAPLAHDANLFNPEAPFSVPHQPAKPAPAPVPAPSGNRRRLVVMLALLVIIGAAAVVAPRILRKPPSSPLGTLAVQTNPPGAQIFVDGVEKGLTPGRVSVSAGAHILELRGRGVPRVIPVTVTAGAEVQQYVELPQTPATGSLTVQSEPAGAKVSVDGVEHGIAPLTVNDLAPGEHEVVLKGNNGEVHQKVVIQAGVTGSVLAPIATAPPAPTSGWVTFRSPMTIDIHEGGRLLGTTDSERIMMAAGRHELVLTNDTLGYRATRAVQVPPGKVAVVSIELPRGVININASPWAEVWIDGKRIGETPIGNLPIAIGAHEVVFRHPQFGEKRQAVSVTTNAPVRLSMDMR
jgi:PEGA domain-containing protein